MRVLFLSPVGILGGAERSLLDLIASLRGAAAEVHVGLLATADGPLVAEAEKLGAEVRVVPMGAALEALGDSGLRGRSPFAAAATLLQGSARAAVPFVGYLRRFRQEVEAFGPSLLHSNGMKAHLLGALRPDPRRPLVWHMRDFVGERPLMARALRAASGRAQLVLANSEAVAQDARGVLPGVPVRVSYNAIDTAHFSPGPADGARLDALAQVPPAPAGTLRIGLVATYSRWKGHDVFLRAATLVRAIHSELPARFYVVGGPVYRTEASQFTPEELERLAGPLRGDGPGEAGPSVAFVPFQDSTRDVYRALDGVVHASTRREPFGRTIVEAMACGRPVIVSRAGGAAELFTDGVDALGVPPGNAQAMAEAIVQLLRDAGLRERLATAGRATALRRFSRERLGHELLAHYRGLNA